MASRYLMLSDLKKRHMMFKREPHSMLLRCLYNEHLLYSNYRVIDSLHAAAFHFAHYLNMKRTIHSMYISKVRNRCIISGNARAVAGAYRLSRFSIKMLARQGQLNGITKSS
jgi:ribosomal protein S14